MSGLYVYALADRLAVSFRTAGRTIDFEDLGGIYAAVEQRTAPPVLSEEELRIQHAIVAAIALEADAVLPARFGSFTERTDLQRVIDDRRGTIRDALDLVRGRSQMTLRITRDGASQDSAVRSRAHHSRLDRPGTQYLLGRQAAARPELAPEIIDAINTAVGTLAVASRLECGEGIVAAKLYHLIARGTDPEYRRATASLELTGLTIVVTGPWPAFAFAPELWP
jgi:hypothetical protein